jgi:hypothetical protein
MKYLCLVYHDEKQIDALPESEYAVIVSDVLDYREELRQSGHYIALLRPGSNLGVSISSRPET